LYILCTVLTRFWVAHALVPNCFCTFTFLHNQHFVLSLFDVSPCTCYHHFVPTHILNLHNSFGVFMTTHFDFELWRHLVLLISYPQKFQNSESCVKLVHWMDLSRREAINGCHFKEQCMPGVHTSTLLMYYLSWQSLLPFCFCLFCG
jgi:hypothetical protein